MKKKKILKAKRKVEKALIEMSKENAILRKDLRNMADSFVEALENASYYKKELQQREQSSLEERRYATSLETNRTCSEGEEKKCKVSENGNDGALAINDVVWNGDETTVFWGDGTSTTVRRANGDSYDKQTAVAYAISKKVLASTLENTVKYYSEKDKRTAEKIYRCLLSNDAKKRQCANKRWADVPRRVRQSVKESAKNNGIRF